METAIADWVNLILRWLHVMTGIAWIGTSFFFVWLDLSLRRTEATPTGVQGDSWMVHGGGFYHARKYVVAPDALPKTLHWFKYEAYFTWISGMLLLAVVYYWGAETYLIDPSVADWEPWEAIALSLAVLVGGWVIYDGLCRSPLGRDTRVLAVLVFVLVVGGAYLLTHLFSGRAAFLHVGAMIGTIMAANVFIIIIPNQRRAVAQMMAGDRPDPELGKQAKQRSLHNNYLTLPVVLMMISNHYPMAYGVQEPWLVVAAIVVIGAIVRDYFNRSHAGGIGWTVRWQWPAAAALTLALIAAVSLSTDKGADVPALAEADAFLLVQSHCTVCHAATPVHDGFDAPPGGVRFETMEEVRRHAARAAVQVGTGAMPLGNESGLVDDERRALAAWLRRQAEE